MHVSFLQQDLAFFEDEARVNRQVGTLIFPSRDTAVAGLVFCVMKLTYVFVKPLNTSCPDS